MAEQLGMTAPELLADLERIFGDRWYEDDSNMGAADALPLAADLTAAAALGEVSAMFTGKR